SWYPIPRYPPPAVEPPYACKTSEKRGSHLCWICVYEVCPCAVAPQEPDRICLRNVAAGILCEDTARAGTKINGRNFKCHFVACSSAYWHYSPHPRSR